MPTAGDDHTSPSVLNTHLTSELAGGAIAFLPECCASWRNIGQCGSAVPRIPSPTKRGSPAAYGPPLTHSVSPGAHGGRSSPQLERLRATAPAARCRATRRRVGEARSDTGRQARPSIFLLSMRATVVSFG